ncbi:TIGR00730 family Rossman fold protein [Phenylobacterium sp.]|uniref:LOG family protein n=1 Tax=Phenylobacterium sp. TaxID=1871053 RepID=UPI00286D1E8B|nr:TIGR00730 family Rossman fold protein [Phenylobacterium sp.]
MGKLASVCVFCGSSPGGDPAYRAAAETLGRAVANRGQRLVYGGAKVGLMGALADAALDAGGEVVGVIPAALADKEIAHDGLSRLEIVASMHERKARMAELSDGFIALPGGVGTLEEIFEIWTWGQLGFHAKPAGFLNALGYYNALRNFVDHAVGEAFLQAPHRDMIIFREDTAQMLDAMDAYAPPVVEKWIGRPEL